MLTEGDGRIFVVIGGFEAWHGIPQEVLDRAHGGTLVFAKREEEWMRVFEGPLRPLAREVDRLYASRSGQPSFAFEYQPGHAFIKQIPGARLDLIAEFTYGPEDKANDERIRASRAAISKLTPTEREALVKSLEDGSEEG